MIRETFLAPLYTLRVGSIGAAHAARVSCMCGAGPWYLHIFWLRQRHSEHEFLRWIMGSLTCPKCGQRDCMAWVVVEALPGRAEAEMPGQSKDE